MEPMIFDYIILLVVNILIMSLSIALALQEYAKSCFKDTDKLLNKFISVMVNFVLIVLLIKIGMSLRILYAGLL